MALSKAFVASLLLVLAAHLAESQEFHSATAERSLKASIDCGAACRVRCSLFKKPKMCHKVCGTCCARCNCVPPGTSFYTRSQCPCYATMTTHGGRLKCP